MSTQQQLDDARPSTSGSGSRNRYDEEEEEEYTGGGGGGGDGGYMKLMHIGSSYNKKYRVYDKEYMFNFKNKDHDDDDDDDEVPKKKKKKSTRDILQSVLNEVVNYAKSQVKEFKEGTDLLRIIISNHKLNNPISSDFKCDDPVHSLLEKMMAILTSNETIKLEDTTFHVQMICLPTGAGRTGVVNLAVDRRMKRSIVRR